MVEGTVVITGAGGFIGRNLAAYLAERDHPTLLITPRDDPALRALQKATLRVGRAADVLIAEDLSAVSAIVHLACSTNVRTGTVADELRQLGELNAILEHIRATEVQFVFLSSGGTVYADSPEPHSESSPVAPRSAHAWGKLGAERLIELHGRTSGLAHSIVRCANAYGPGQVVKNQGLIMKLLQDMRAGATTEIWGSGDEARDYFFVDDLCALIASTLARPETRGVFNAGSGRALSVNDVLDAIEAAIGRRPQVAHGPARPEAVHCNVLSCERAADAFGWKAETPMADGLRATWAWLTDSP